MQQRYDLSIQLKQNKLVPYKLFVQEFLRNPERYLRLGARPPRGVLLVSSAIDFSNGDYYFTTVSVTIM